MSETVKEINFIKQVERTAKRDAYNTAVRYIEHFGPEQGLKIIKLKAAGHSEYLAELPLSYDYATQSLVEKSKAIDGQKVHEKLADLMNAIAGEEKS